MFSIAILSPEEADIFGPATKTHKLLRARFCSISGEAWREKHETWQFHCTIVHTKLLLSYSLPSSVNRIQNLRVKFSLNHWISYGSGFSWGFYMQFPAKFISQAIISQLNFFQRSQNLGESLNRHWPVIQVSHATWSQVNFNCVVWSFVEDPSGEACMRPNSVLFAPFQIKGNKQQDCWHCCLPSCLCL